MARPRKPLIQLVMEGTFCARKQRGRLEEADLPYPALAALQQQYRQATRESERQAIARDFERAVRLIHARTKRLAASGQLDAMLAELGPAGSAEQLLAFFPSFLFHEMGPKAGERFALEPFQQEFLLEFFRRGPDGRRIYRQALLGLPRGNGKSPLAAGLGIYTLLSQPDAPRVFCAAGSKEQARICLDFARAWAERGELQPWLAVKSNLIRCEERLGVFSVLSSDGRLSHGLQPSAAILDELWLLSSYRERESFVSLQSALHKREDAWLLAISTAGYDRSSLLGQIYEQALALPDVDQRADGCLTIARDPDSRFLLWWYGAPAQADPEDEGVLRACNPASWLSTDELLRLLHAPGTDEYEWRRLHLNQWTKTRDAWLPAGCWRGLRSDCEIPRGAEVYVGIDVALRHDSSAVCVGHRLEDGRVILQSKVWSTRDDVAHHICVPGGEMRLELITDHLLELNERYSICEVVYDPTFFSGEAQRLEHERFDLAPVYQASGQMAEAYQQFYQACLEGKLTHDGDPVLTAHVEATAAEMTERGWKVRKLKPQQRIDGCVAAVIAHWRAAHGESRRSIYETRDLFVIGADDDDGDDDDDF